MRQLTPYEQTQLARYSGEHRYTEAEIGSKPVEYVTKIAEFCGLPFFVDERVLIPRLETEELVELALQTLTEKVGLLEDKQKLVVGDVGTGAGAIAIVLAKHFDGNKKLEFYASDVYAAAIEVAQVNAQKFLTPTMPPVQFFVSDLLEQYPKGVKFDLLVSNLPYIPSDRIKVLDESVKDHEPHIALDGGPEGLTLIGKFLEQAQHLLKPGGVVLLEVDYTHTAADFAPLAQGYSVDVFTDSFTRNRFARLVFLGK